MAKAKKTAALTVEERLEQALVPEGEQPYSVPANWCWTRLKTISTIIMGQSPSGENTTENSDFMPLVCGAADMGVLFPEVSRYTKVPTKVSEDGDIILCIRATLGRPIFSNGQYCLGRGVTAIRSPICTSEFLRYFFICFEQYLYDNATGTTFEQVNSTVLQDMPFTFPPISEQQRIVDRIESLVAKLDEAKEKAQAALDSFETRKAAILHKAFTGELTAKWREKNGITLETWHMTQFGDLILDGPQNGLYKPKTAYGTGIKIIRIDSFYDGNIEPWDTLKSLELSDAERELYGLRQGDLLINRVNSMAYLGKSALVRVLPNECVFESNVMRLSLKLHLVCPEFAVRFLNSAAGLSELRKNAKQAVNQASINQQDVKSVEFLLPSIKEQAEIICLLEDFFTKEQKAKELCSVLDNIDLIKKSILARAFRGELGTNDPAEESAVELLKSIV